VYGGITMEIISQNLNSMSDQMQLYNEFENLVLDALSKYLIKQNKRFFNNVITSDDMNFIEFDGVAPDGIDDLLGETLIEIKFYQNKQNYLRNGSKIAEKLSNRLNKFTNFRSILVVLAANFTNEEKEKINNIFGSRISYPVKIWDLNDLCKINNNFDKLLSGDYSILSKLIVKNTVSGVLERKPNNWIEDRNQRLNELKNLYKKDDLVLFLGAGISKDAGIKEWNELITDLLVAMIRSEFNNSSVSINDLEANFILQKMKRINDNSPLLQAAFIKAGLGDSFENEVSKIMYKSFVRKNKGISKLLMSISRLCQPGRSKMGVKAVVTYNFDDLLEINLDTLNVEYHSIYNENECSNQDELGIYHVHGFLPRNAPHNSELTDNLLVFSEDGYHSLYNDPYSWANITQLNFLRENTVLMIGLSLTDPNLRRLLSISNRKTNNKRHYAIMKKYKLTVDDGDYAIRNDILEYFNDVNDKLQERFYEQLGVKIIWVEEYEEIPKLIDYLKSNNDNINFGEEIAID
jgi:hypothetical protein